MSQQLLPLNNAPNQTFVATLQVDGSPLILQLTLRYNDVAKYWATTISDQNGDLLLDSIPLITGDNPACNLLRQFDYLEIGSLFILNTTGSVSPDYPDNTNLGVGFVAVWGDTQ